MLSFFKGAIIGLILFLVGAAYARADNLGLSYLGICNKTWRCEDSLKAFNGLDTIRVGWLAHSFGDPCPCADKILSDPRPKEVRIHLANSTCFRERGRICGPHEMFHGETIASADRKVREGDPTLMSRFNYIASVVRKAVRGRANLKCWVSPCLECNLGKEARMRLIERAKAMLPMCEIVDNPISDTCIPGMLCEKHGPDSPATRPQCGADLDGDDFQKEDMPAFAERFRRCEYAHVWGGKFNCLPESGGFVDPRQRDCSKTPKKYWEAAARYIRPGGAVKPPLKPLNKRDLRGCKTQFVPKDGPGGFTLKDSDTHPGTVLMVPKNLPRFSDVKLVRGRKTLATFNFVAFFHGDGRPIYRSPTSQTTFETNSVLKADGMCWVLDYPMFRID